MASKKTIVECPSEKKKPTLSGRAADARRWRVEVSRTHPGLNARPLARREGMRLGIPRQEGICDAHRFNASIIRDGMEIMSKRVSARAAKIGAIAVAAIGMAVGPAPHQAQAASSISASLAVTQVGSGDSHRTQATIDVHLPMSQEDAAGYLYNRARIMIACWGDDYFFDDWLLSYDNDGDPTEDWTSNPFTPYNVQNGQPYAAPDGVRLKWIISEPHGEDPSAPDVYDPSGVRGFNEDAFYTGDDIDEVFCRATWIDGDGARLAAFTPVRRGTF